MHISFKEEISSVRFISASCPDGTLWLPEDVIAHSLDMQILEIPGNLIDCDLSDPELEVLHAYLTRLCLGPDVAGGLVLQNLLNSSHGNLQGSTVGDILAFAVHVANGGRPEPSHEYLDFNVTLAQGIHHVGEEYGPLPYECACIFDQNGESAFFSFVLDSPNSVQNFFLRTMNPQNNVIGPFTLQTPFVGDLIFPGWVSFCAAIADHIDLDIASMKQSLFDVNLIVTSREDPTSGICECLVQNLFGLEISARLTPGGEYDMTTLWCSAVNGSAADCPDRNFQCGVPPPGIFSAACSGRRRPQISPRLQRLEDILARDRV